MAPLALRATVPPGQILELAGVTVRLSAGLNDTLMLAVAVPQLATATTDTVPAEDPKLTVATLELAPEVMLAPAGTVQV